MSRITSRESRVPRILVVDDMPDNLFLMNGLFEDRYDVVQAGSGQEALAIVMGDNPPDMILLDIMMPDMDGYEVLRRMRQHPATANIPVIFLSALASAEEERLGKELGAIDYLTKPIDPIRVMQRVEANVRSSVYTRRVDLLSEKLARHVSPESWARLFHGPDANSISFEEKQQTILYAVVAGRGLQEERDRDSFRAEVEWLATRHRGNVDRYEDAACVVAFDEPAACMRMALDLQNSARSLDLRVGVHTGICEIGTFRSEHEMRCTLIGLETRLAAKVAATATTPGSIAVSAETYALVKDDIHADASRCQLTEEFQDSDRAEVCLKPPSSPVRASR